jgi:hypothetical protein
LADRHREGSCRKIAKLRIFVPDGAHERTSKQAKYMHTKINKLNKQANKYIN